LHSALFVIPEKGLSRCPSLSFVEDITSTILKITDQGIIPSTLKAMKLHHVLDKLMPRQHITIV
jgi:hypothetical protein